MIGSQKSGGASGALMPVAGHDLYKTIEDINSNPDKIAKLLRDNLEIILSSNLSEISQLLLALAIKKDRFSPTLELLSIVEKAIKLSISTRPKPSTALSCKLLSCISKLVDNGDIEEKTIDSYVKEIILLTRSQLACINHTQTTIILKSFARLGYNIDVFNPLDKNLFRTIANKILLDKSSLSLDQLGFLALDFMKFKMPEESEKIRDEITARLSSIAVDLPQTLTDKKNLISSQAIRALYQAGYYYAIEKHQDIEGKRWPVFLPITTFTKLTALSKKFGKYKPMSQTKVSSGQKKVKKLLEEELHFTTVVLENVTHQLEVGDLESLTEEDFAVREELVIKADILAINGSDAFIIEYDGPNHYNTRSAPNTSTNERDFYRTKYIKQTNEANKPTEHETKYHYLKIPDHEFRKSQIKGRKGDFRFEQIEYLKSLLEISTQAAVEDALAVDAPAGAGHGAGASASDVVVADPTKIEKPSSDVVYDLITDEKQKTFLDAKVADIINKDKLEHLKLLISKGLNPDYIIEGASQNVLQTLFQLLETESSDSKRMMIIALIEAGANLDSITEDQLLRLLETSNEIGDHELNLLQILGEKEIEVSLLRTNHEKAIEFISAAIKTGHKIALPLLTKLQETFTIDDMEKFFTSIPQNNIAEDESEIIDFLINKNSELKDSTRRYVDQPSGRKIIRAARGPLLERLEKLMDRLLYNQENFDILSIKAKLESFHKQGLGIESFSTLLYKCILFDNIELARAIFDLDFISKDISGLFRDKSMVVHLSSANPNPAITKGASKLSTAAELGSVEMFRLILEKMHNCGINIYEKLTQYNEDKPENIIIALFKKDRPDIVKEILTTDFIYRNKEQKFSLLRNDHKKTTERDVLFAPISSSVFGYAQLDGSLKHYFSVIAESMSGDDLLELIGDRDKTIINNINTKILQIDPGFQIDVKKNFIIYFLEKLTQYDAEIFFEKIDIKEFCALCRSYPLPLSSSNNLYEILFKNLSKDDFLNIITNEEDIFSDSFLQLLASSSSNKNEIIEYILNPLSPEERFRLFKHDRFLAGEPTPFPKLDQKTLLQLISYGYITDVVRVTEINPDSVEQEKIVKMKAISRTAKMGEEEDKKTRVFATKDEIFTADVDNFLLPSTLDLLAACIFGNSVLEKNRSKILDFLVDEKNNDLFLEFGEKLQPDIFEVIHLIHESGYKTITEEERVKFNSLKENGLEFLMEKLLPLIIADNPAMKGLALISSKPLKGETTARAAAP